MYFSMPRRESSSWKTFSALNVKAKQVGSFTGNRGELTILRL